MPTEPDTRPAILVQEWAEQNGIEGPRARRWAREGIIPAYRSLSAWLIAPDAAVPDLPTGAAAHKRRRSAGEATGG